MRRTLHRLLSSRAERVLQPFFTVPKTGPITLSGVFDGKSWVPSNITTSVKTKTGKSSASNSKEMSENESVNNSHTPSICPSTGEVLALISAGTPLQTHEIVQQTRQAFLVWRKVPPARRALLLLALRAELSAKQDELGALIALEQGKILTEGKGEVQEAIDVLDFAVGLGRQIGARGVGSERPDCTISEVPNPLGVIGVISASNFPVAVFFWNFAIALITGNSTVWKGSPKTNLCSVAVMQLVSGVLEKGNYPPGLLTLVCGGKDVGEVMVHSSAVDMVSFTGSEHVGRQVAVGVASRFGKSLLELGGNNAAVVMDDADMDLAIPAVLFASVGTAGQRCTSTRRLFLHRSIADDFLRRLKAAYSTLKIGDPLEEGILMGPVHGTDALKLYQEGIADVKKSGGEIITGGMVISKDGELKGGSFAAPTIALHYSPLIPLFQKETFAPILNVAVFETLKQAIAWNNAVPQGLSSTLFSRDIKNIGLWTGPEGSDCGIVNVNVSTSGAEIGAAFGGNKSTGWGRESGGDSWKQYVRWSSCTLNYGDEMPLAQGVSFGTTD